MNRLRCTALDAPFIINITASSVTEQARFDANSVRRRYPGEQGTSDRSPGSPAQETGHDRDNAVLEATT